MISNGYIVFLFALFLLIYIALIKVFKLSEEKAKKVTHGLARNLFLALVMGFIFVTIIYS